MAGTITALVAQKKNKDRVSVYLDGKFAFGLAAIEAVKLKRGQVLRDEDIARLRERDDVEKAHERALHFLSFRPRSEAEVRRNLADAKAAPEAIEMVIERLKRAGLVDDRAFTQYWLENRGQFSPRSARVLKSELRQKGITAETIDEVLQAVAHDENEAAFQAALPRARRLTRLELREFKQKLGAYLLRRGFTYEVASEAVRRAWEEVRAESSDSTFDLTSED
ncbi:MAG TPA: RecX family transcriptional regulator [Anaerolineae bacterium]|nr:RecX family transcriptional regulator [Anaerolineae bacterium]